MVSSTRRSVTGNRQNDGMSDQGSCPVCGSADVAPILYGLPSQEGFEAAERGEVMLGGCEPHDPSHGCRACGAEWSDDDEGTASADGGDAAQLIAGAFNSYFRNWNIEITPRDVQPGHRASVADRGWRISYLVDTDEAGELFLEFYATHRMTDDRHVLVSSSGDMRHLDAINGMVVYDPKVGGDRERASRKNIERNRVIADELKAKGLFPSGDINTFLRTGGMEGVDTLKEMRRVLDKANLPMPFIPEHLRHDLYAVRKWCWATRDIEPFDMYYFDRYLVEAVVARPDDYFAFCHAGHGINSYAITYQIVVGRVALFAQVPWGGGYMDKAQQAVAVAEMLERCSEFLAGVPDLPSGPLLLIGSSELRGCSWCGWVPTGLDEDAARRWLMSGAITVSEPLRTAKELLNAHE